MHATHLAVTARAVPYLAFPEFADVAPEILAAEENTLRSPRDVLSGAWAEYLRRMLPQSAGEQDRAA